MSRKLIEWADLGIPPDPEDAREFRFPALRKAWRVVSRLRSYYPDIVQSDRSPYQLHAGLMRYAMHTLSFDESDRRQRLFALYSGALCARLLKTYIRETRRLRIDFLRSPSAAGRIGLTILPGRADRDRDIDEDLGVLREEGIRRVLCLITDDEFREYGVVGLPRAYEDAGFLTRRLPILDQGVPSPEELPPVLDWMEEGLKDGERLLVHCVGGLGRSGLLAAAYLRLKEGMGAQEAISLVRESRDERAIENARQEDFIRALN